MPVGAVLIGRAGEERALLAAGHAVESAIGLGADHVASWSPPRRG
jgi:Asp-tRNA(Asn)/Glu-tRNA(Gln) amidotransferase A subunit family amidase